MKQVVRKLTQMIPMLALSLLVLGSMPSAADAISVDWTGPNEDFRSATIAVTPFTADSLDSITDNIGNFARWRGDAGSSRTIRLDVRVDGSFITLATSAPVASGQSFLFSSIMTPIAFSSGLIDQIRVASSNPTMSLSCASQNACFREFAGLTFNFSDSTSTGPEPGTIFLFGSGLAGLAAWRYKKRTRV